MNSVTTRSARKKTAAGVIAGALAAGGCNGSGTAADAPPPPIATNVIAPTVTPLVTWPSADAIDARVLDGLGDARSLVVRSPVPVLAPAIDLERLTFVVEGEFYALTGRSNGATINVQGTRAARRYEGVDPHPGNRPLRGARGFVTVNEAIRTASFVENGAAYSVDVECASVADSRCASDRFVVELVEQLAYVGGAGR